MQFIPFNRNKKNQSDAELLDNYLKNNNQDFLGELYSRYIHLVYGVCLKYLNDRESAKDAVIELYEKILIEIGKHKISNFKSWLYVVTKNYCLTKLRKRKPGELILTSSDEELAGFMENEEELHPIDRDHDEQLEKALADCIAKLKAEQKKCIQLFYYKNKCYREIANLLAIEEKKVKSFIQNGKRNLKICLESKK